MTASAFDAAPPASLERQKVYQRLRSRNAGALWEKLSELVTARPTPGRDDGTRRAQTDDQRPHYPPTPGMLRKSA